MSSIFTLLAVFSTLAILVSSVAVQPPAVNLRPIIGVVSQPVSNPDVFKYGSSYINSDYVKWIESSGARVVPIHFDSSPCELSATLQLVNGIVFMGGGDILNHTAYYAASASIWQQAMSFNDKGDYFPIHGTCLGIELEAVVLDKGDVSILESVDAENITLPVKWRADYPPSSSRMLGSFPQAVLDAMASKDAPVTENYHHYGIRIASVWDTDKANVKEYFNLIATSFDRNGVEFVAQWEGKDYPFYGVQWHPERPLFEWDPTEDISHTPLSILTSQLTGDFFISETTRSAHRFPSDDAEMDALIYNFEPLYVGKVLGDDEQFYFWNYTSPLSSSSAPRNAFREYIAKTCSPIA